MTLSVRPREIQGRRRRAGALASVAAAWLAACAGSFSQEPNPAGETGMVAFGRLVPLGYVSQEVRIPSFGDDGTIASVVTAATIVRIDDDHLKAGKTTVEVAGKTPAEDIRIDLPTAVYHMGERILRSAERCRVSRSDFQVEGDSLVFSADSSIGKMQGRVRTIIFDTAAVSGKSKGVPKPTN